jgi:PAS domain S-box-containing protein
VSDRHNAAPAVRSELGSDLQGVLVRVHSLIGRLEEDTAARGYLEELAEAIREVGETRRQLVDRATHLEQLMRDERRRYHELFDRALRDVSERKTAEEALRSLNADLERRIEQRTRELTDATARLESVLQEMPHGVIIVDTSGKVEMANRRAEELAGLTKEQLGNIVEARPWEMYGRDGRELDQDEQPIARALATGEPVAGERLRVVRSDGTTLYLEFAATPVHGRDGIATVIATFSDVTAQELRERAERDFITNASHELQTPIAAITSAIEVLEAGAKDRPKDRERFLHHIAQSCERLTRLTHALLVLARAQTGDERPRREVIAVEPLLQNVRESLARQREIQIDCAPDLAVIGNRPLLEQAILNLAHNAVKHTSGSVRIDAAAADGQVAIAVRDSGAGIAAADKERVFERFYRNGTASQGGFGLGLAIVAEVARALDGELGVESSDRGTSVALSLPATRLGPR